MKPRREHGPWPHGKQTVRCIRCGGTGLDRTRALVYGTSRAYYNGDQERVDQVLCAQCHGRGRILVDRSAPPE